MVSRRRFLVLIGVGLPAAAGVGAAAWALPGDEASAKEPDVQWGAEECAHCRMIIDDRRFAAAWISGDGTQAHFDDIGCMVAMVREQGEDAGTRYFVQHYEEETWLDATAAAYVRQDGVRSPMSYNVAAYPAGAAPGGADLRGSWTWKALIEDLEKDA